MDTTPLTPEEIGAGRQLGAEIASELVAQIQAMGLPTAHASPGAKVQVNDFVTRGYLLSVKEGSTAKRVVIGSGSGSSRLSTMVEGFQMTAQGLRKLGVGTVEASGNKTPSASLGVATFLATADPAGLIINAGSKV